MNIESIVIVWVDSMNSQTKEFKPEEINTINEYASSIEDKFDSDDYWIDQVWLEGTDIPSAVQTLVQEVGASGQNVDEALFEKIIENEDEFAEKLSFLKDYGYDVESAITKIEEGEVFVHYKSGEGFLDIEEDFAMELFEEFNPEFYQEMQNNGLTMFFDFKWWLKDISLGDIRYEVNEDGDYIIWMFQQ